MVPAPDDTLVTALIIIFCVPPIRVLPNVAELSVFHVMR